MLRKKLLTIACAAGILACGACFLPPLPQRKAPLPPTLASIHLIAIDVEDGTSRTLFDPRIMSNATASKFNQLWTDFPVRAEAFNETAPRDAVLKITVLRKTASCNPEGSNKQLCSFELIVSFTLIAGDGKMLQSAPQKSSGFRVVYKRDSLPENLDENPFRQAASYSLAMTAGEVLFYSESQ